MNPLPGQETQAGLVQTARLGFARGADEHSPHSPQSDANIDDLEPQNFRVRGYSC